MFEKYVIASWITGTTRSYWGSPEGRARCSRAGWRLSWIPGWMNRWGLSRFFVVITLIITVIKTLSRDSWGPAGKQRGGTVVWTTGSGCVDGGCPPWSTSTFLREGKHTGYSCMYGKAISAVRAPCGLTFDGGGTAGGGVQEACELQLLAEVTLMKAAEVSPPHCILH